MTVEKSDTGLQFVGSVETVLNEWISMRRAALKPRHDRPSADTTAAIGNKAEEDLLDDLEAFLRRLWASSAAWELLS